MQKIFAFVETTLLLALFAVASHAQDLDPAAALNAPPPPPPPPPPETQSVLPPDIAQLPIEVITAAPPAQAPDSSRSPTPLGVNPDPLDPNVDPLTGADLSIDLGVDVGLPDATAPIGLPVPPDPADPLSANIGLHHRRLPNNPRTVLLEAGMNYINEKGQLVPAEEIVEATPDGAVARRTQIKATFSSDLNVSGAVDMTTPDGVRLRATPLGISYYDAATGQSVMIAETRSAKATIVPPNKVVYEDFLDDASADLVLEVKKSGIMQTVVIKGSLPSPSSFGLSDDTSRLEVITEFAKQYLSCHHLACRHGDTSCAL